MALLIVGVLTLKACTIWPYDFPEAKCVNTSLSLAVSSLGLDDHCVNNHIRAR